jgi:hypothetical protein
MGHLEKLTEPLTGQKGRARKIDTNRQRVVRVPTVSGEASTSKQTADCCTPQMVRQLPTLVWRSTGAGCRRSVVAGLMLTAAAEVDWSDRIAGGPHTTSLGYMC